MDRSGEERSSCRTGAIIAEWLRRLIEDPLEESPRWLEPHSLHKGWRSNECTLGPTVVSTGACECIARSRPNRNPGVA